MAFLSCDWGSSSFRLRLVEDRTLAVLSEVRSTAGCSSLAPAGLDPQSRREGFAAAFADHLERLEGGAPNPDVPLVLSGMVTSAHGWLELPYAELPLRLDGRGLTIAARRLPNARQAFFVSGVRDRLDVMRGEECELLGLASWPGWRDAAAEGAVHVLLPGTHCKHAVLSRGAVRRFQTFMTGELYDLLRRHSVLRHSLPPLGEVAEGLDLEALAQGVRDCRRYGLAGALFQVRVRGLLAAASAAAGDAYLNGALIAAEFAGLPPSRCRGTIVLCAKGRTRQLYETVLGAIGLGSRLVSVPADIVETLSMRGHAAVLSTGLAAGVGAGSEKE